MCENEQHGREEDFLPARSIVILGGNLIDYGEEKCGVKQMVLEDDKVAGDNTTVVGVDLRSATGSGD